MKYQRTYFSLGLDFLRENIITFKLTHDFFFHKNLRDMILLHPSTGSADLLSQSTTTVGEILQFLPDLFRRFLTPVT